jgi:hypothetical protein
MFQTHDKFKFFKMAYSSSPLDALNMLLKDIESWVKDNKIAPKSIGIAILEKSQDIIMSLGFRDDTSYEISLTTVKASATIEQCLNDDCVLDQTFVSSGDLSNNDIICHELFIIDDELHMIFMKRN